ncbi:MAG: DUF1499 domain-containing protein [bacterium]|nr:DUF1499 domain-containing protein [bacterium]MDT8395416.1 DUF1499 domain-containing protein [bacterium]
MITEKSLLPPCPGTPNCVSSQSTDVAKRVDPLPVVDGPAMSMERLTRVVSSIPRTTIVSDSGTMLQVEFRSFLGFVDDVLFVLSDNEGVIHVRSASRTGKWDLGVNRRRVNRIRKLYLVAE